MRSVHSNGSCSGSLSNYRLLSLGGPSGIQGEVSSHLRELSRGQNTRRPNAGRAGVRPCFTGLGNPPPSVTLAGRNGITSQRLRPAIYSYVP
jgi:hypothetical protein